MRNSIVRMAAMLLSMGPALAQADAVLDWNKVALDAIVASKQPAPQTTRSMAIVHAAIFDAVNSIEGRYAAYRQTAKPPAGTSVASAAAGAAHGALTALFPDQKESLDRALAAAVSAPATDSGVRFGETVGADMVASRAGDGAVPQGPYRPLAMAGRYIPTAIPAFSPWAHATPFAMDRPDQFRPGPPPALASAQWAADFNEIKSLGGKNSAARTAEQTETGQFWAVTGAPAYNLVLRDLAGRGSRDEIRNARLFALAYLAAADSLIAVFDAKYFYEFWRPITAIRNGDIDGNDATVEDLNWTPLIDTPLHPEYPCAHCINAAAVGAVLESEFGKGAIEPFAMTSPTAPGVTHHWTRISDFVAEVSNARVWSGVHYRTSTRIGEQMGREIGELAVARLMRPVR